MPSLSSIDVHLSWNFTVVSMWPHHNNSNSSNIIAISAARSQGLSVYAIYCMNYYWAAWIERDHYQHLWMTYNCARNDMLSLCNDAHAEFLLLFLWFGSLLTLISNRNFHAHSPQLFIVFIWCGIGPMWSVPFSSHCDQLNMAKCNRIISRFSSGCALFLPN